MSKKIVLALALISLFIGASSCQKEIVESVDDNNDLISFKAVLGKPSTKAAEFKYWANGGKINVYSYYSGVTTPFNEFELTYSSGSWTYGGSVNQPGVPIRYYSVYPEPVAYDKDNIATTGGQWAESVTATDKPFTYIVKTSGDKSDQQNIIADAQEDLVAATYSGLNEQVTLQFKHLLSQVNVAVQGMIGVKIVVKDIKLNDIVNKGTYSFIVPENNGSQWTLSKKTTDVAAYNYFPIDSANTALATGASSNVIYLGNGGTVNKYNKTNALMLMPQSFAKDATKKPTLTFGFELLPDKDGNGQFEATEDNSKDGAAKTGSVTVDLCDFETTTWLSSKRYVYLIDFTSYLAGGPITFKVTVDDWKNYDETEGDKGTGIVGTLHVPNASQGSIEAAIAMHSAANGAKSALKVFPISVAERPTSADMLAITKITGFNEGDVINIEFPAKGNDDPELNTIFFCAAPGWTTSTIADGARVVTLTCGNTPNDVADYASNVSAAANGADGKTTLEDLMSAIYTQKEASTSTSSLKYFPITVSAELVGDMTLKSIIGFQSGDKIIITFKNKTEADKIKGVATGWTMDNPANSTSNGLTYGNVAILTCTDALANNVEAAENITAQPATLSALYTAIYAQDTKKNTNNKTIFPINITNEFDATTVYIPAILSTYFVENDIIFITCKDAKEAAKISCSAYNWNTFKAGNVVLLTCTGAPGVAAAIPAGTAGTPVTLENLETAIIAQGSVQTADKNASNLLEIFPIDVEDVFAGNDISLRELTTQLSNFGKNDLLYIICKSEADAKKIYCFTDGWVISQWSNIVTLRRLD